MKKFSVALIALAIVLAIAPVAKADSINLATVGAVGSGAASFDLNFSLSGGVVQTASGYVTFNPGAGSTTVAITGLVTGVSFAQQYGLSNPGNTGGYDQQLSLTFPYLDSLGLALTLAGGDQLKIWVYPTSGDTATLRVQDVDPAGDQNTYHESATDLITYTPEPGSLVLFGTGLIGFAGLLRRKYMVSR
jgi:hypothetical protein